MRYVVSRSMVALVFCVLTAPVLRSAEVTESKYMVPMRDGTRLATVVHRPAGAEQPLPVIFARGPYGTFTKAIAEGFCRRGYVLVSQDMRGRFGSDGSDAVIFFNDGWGARRDGQESIDWIVRQPWCSGSVGTWGGSALGITQNLLAPGAPAALKAQHVMVAFSDMYSQCAYQGGVWRKALMEPWLKANQFDPESLVAFRAHPRYDDFWAQVNAEPQADRVSAPAVYWGGWYDIFLQGTLNSFVTVQSRAAAPARGNCRLIVGPYAHGLFDELKYPDSAGKPPAAGDFFRFYDHWLGGADNGVDQDQAVHYYVMGNPEDADAPGNFWRSADSWPPPSRPASFYFHGDGRLARAIPVAKDAKRTYRYDPQQPVPTVGGQNLNLPKGPMDQRKVEAREDVLTFTTDVLAEPMEVTGRILATLYVASDCPDTDFTVKLTDVYADGRSMLVTDGIQRARYRKSFEREDFLEPARVYQITVDLWSTALVFAAGHRIRVAVSSSNSPRFEPNSNTGGPPTDQATRVATNTVYVSPAHPSKIVLPIYSGK